MPKSVVCADQPNLTDLARFLRGLTEGEPSPTRIEVLCERLG